MPTISITEARKDIFNLADRSKEAATPLLIVNSRGSNFVVISEDDWNDVQETLNLDSIPGFRESIKEARKEDYSKKKAFTEDEEW